MDKEIHLNFLILYVDERQNASKFICHSIGPLQMSARCTSHNGIGYASQVANDDHISIGAFGHVYCDLFRSKFRPKASSRFSSNFFKII